MFLQQLIGVINFKIALITKYSNLSLAVILFEKWKERKESTFPYSKCLNIICQEIKKLEKQFSTLKFKDIDFSLSAVVSPRKKFLILFETLGRMFA